MIKRFRKVFLQPIMLSHIVLLATWVLSLVFLSASQFEISLYHSVTAWFAGWIVWTLAEYLLNRYLLHLPGSSIGFLDAIIQFHLKHHEEPDSIHYNFIHPLLVGLTVAPVMIVSFLIGEGTGLLITSGFIFGYLVFIIIHTCQHHYTAPTAGILKNLWKNHYLHHKSFPNKAYGVSTPLWDFVFRTMPSKRTFLTVDAKNMKTARPSLRVVEVNNSKTSKMFLDLPESIYAEHPGWKPHFKLEIANSFNPLVNPYFTHGVAKRWILVDQSGEVAGRVAAFLDFNKIIEQDDWVGGVGFFECTRNQSAAFQLLDTAVNWLVKSFKVTAVEGPVIFGENGKSSGLLVRGSFANSYGTNYNPGYQKFFEDYGFKVEYKQLTSYLDVCRDN